MQIDPWQVATGCIALLAALLAFIGRLYTGRIENHAKLLVDHTDRLTKLESSQLQKSDLETLERHLNESFETHVKYLRQAIDNVGRDAKEAKELASRK